MPDLNTKIDVDEALRVLDEFRNKTRAEVREANRNSSGVVQIDGATAVTTKKMVMKVLLDPDENYSMSGHIPLADSCFGQFFLMMDKGPEYERQSQRINRIIQSITEKEAFDLALKFAQQVLNEGAGNQDPEGLRDAFFAARVATRLCSFWFDQPDDQRVKIAFEVPSFDHEPPPRCPPDFVWLSMYLFLPHQGGGRVSDPALLFGPMLKKAFLEYVTELRTNRLPEGKLSRVIFEALSEHDDELIAQTIIGVMVGLLPPVIINILLVLQAWRASTPSRFEELKEALQQPGESDPYLRSTAVLKTPLMREMQSNPMPPAIWRTAVKEHTLGDVQIHPEDTIEIRIANATAEDHQAGTTDVFAVFGGDRSATPHPTHSCPAYEAALGIMLGTIYALMTSNSPA